MLLYAGWPRRCVQGGLVVRREAVLLHVGWPNCYAQGDCVVAHSLATPLRSAWPRRCAELGRAIAGSLAVLLQAAWMHHYVQLGHAIAVSSAMPLFGRVAIAGSLACCCMPKHQPTALTPCSQQFLVKGLITLAMGGWTAVHV